MKMTRTVPGLRDELEQDSLVPVRCDLAHARHPSLFLTVQAADVMVVVMRKRRRWTTGKGEVRDLHPITLGAHS